MGILKSLRQFQRNIKFLIKNPAGGYVYHLRAYHHLKIWKPFQQELSRCLRNWSPKTKTIVLVGTSAGYTMDMDWLGQFDHVIGVEPDPLARWIFERRFKKSIHWDHEDYFLSGPSHSLFRLVEANAEAAFLFTNVLGQLGILLSERGELAVDNYLQDLRSFFASWDPSVPLASYHDVFSQSSQNPEIVRDHLTESLFPKTFYKEILDWQLTPYESHKVQWISN